MDKGTRVKIVKGSKGKDQSGVIFWKGPNKWGEGERLGVRADGGDTFWVSDQDVEPAGASTQAEAGPAFNKGDRVSFTVRQHSGTGTIFWIGENKHGPGQRLGVRDDNPEGEEDAVWLDSRQVKPDDGQAPAPQNNHPQQQNGGGDWNQDDDEDNQIPPAESYAMPTFDDGPPLDDSYDQMAANMDEEQE